MTFLLKIKTFRFWEYKNEIIVFSIVQFVKIYLYFCN